MTGRPEILQVREKLRHVQRSESSLPQFVFHLEYQQLGIHGSQIQVGVRRLLPGLRENYQKGGMA